MIENFKEKELLEIWYYPKCSTCQNALKKLEASQKYQIKLYNIKEDKPSLDLLKKWYAYYFATSDFASQNSSDNSNRPETDSEKLNPFFNTSGLLYRELNLKQKRSSMTIEEQLECLASDGMLIKRPVLILNGTKIFFGFSKKTETELLG